MATMDAQSTVLDTELLSLMTDPSYLVNAERLITWANEAFFKEFNLKKDEVLGKVTCEEVCASHLCGTKDCPVAKAQRLHKPASSEELRTNSGGMVRWYLSQAIPLPDKKGIMVSMNDISAVKETQSRLRQMETDLNVIPTPIMEIDTHFTVTYMNPAGAAVAGLTPDEALGKKCYDLFKTPHCKTEKCACARAMKSDSVVSEQTIARPRDGMIVPIRYTGAPIKDAKGNIKGALEYILDVTDEMRQRQAADEKIENLNTIPTPIMSIDT
ncbi:MAG: chemotaxis protein, partial [Desulfobulbaceae bacterium A2]